MTARPRVLVLGGSGWLGTAAVPRLAERFPTSAPPHREADVTDEDAVGAAIAAARADVVVHLAAVNPGAGGTDAMEAVNAAGAGVVARRARAAGADLIHMSTDLVHDGRASPYADDAPPAPVNAYGRTKAAGEALVRAGHPEALVLRTSLVFDPDVPDRFTRSALERLARGEPVALFVDEVRCPVSRAALGAVLAEIVGRRGDPDLRARTLNVAGTQPLTRMELGMRLLRRFGATRLDLVRRVSAAASPDPRPLDLRLDVARARALLRTPLGAADDELGGA